MTRRIRGCFFDFFSLRPPRHHVALAPPSSPPLPSLPTMKPGHLDRFLLVVTIAVIEPPRKAFVRWASLVLLFLFWGLPFLVCGVASAGACVGVVVVVVGRRRRRKQFSSFPFCPRWEVRPPPNTLRLIFSPTAPPFPLVARTPPTAAYSATSRGGRAHDSTAATSARLKPVVA